MPETTADTERLGWSVDEFARKHHCSRAHVHNLIRRGQIPSYKLGRRRYIPVDAIDRLIAAENGE